MDSSFPLQILGLSDNDLTGRIPWELGHKLTNLQGVGSRLNRNIPNSVANCSQPTTLGLFRNKLCGMVPVQLGDSPLYKPLNFAANQTVSGSSTELPLFTYLTNCFLLQWMVLPQNRRIGILSSAMGHFSPKLTFLNLADNFIGGGAPLQISNPTNLAFLSLAANIFNSSTPFRRLQKLETLYLTYNELEGSIPSEMGRLQSLGLLFLDDTMLSEPIPQSRDHFQRLKVLQPSVHQLSGSDCWHLEVLHLSYNRLNGNIPPEVAGLIFTIIFQPLKQFPPRLLASSDW